MASGSRSRGGTARHGHSHGSKTPQLMQRLPLAAGAEGAVAQAAATGERQRLHPHREGPGPRHPHPRQPAPTRLKTCLRFRNVLRETYM